ncbi:MAG: hypothetical protein E7058_07610 [Lentisphaerae bacterium]|nr:hypothetical protein [Lentisphaerota bacterium]
MKRQQRSYNFSCVELGIAAAVFCIGGALLFPALSSAQSAAKQASCLDNLKTCIMATTAYANDHNGTAILKYGDSSTGKLLMTMAQGVGVANTRVKMLKRLNISDIVCPDTTVVPKRVTWHFSEFYAVPYGLFNNNYSLTPYEKPEGFYMLRKWPHADVAVNFKKLQYPDSAVIYAEAWNSKIKKAHSTYGLAKNETTKLDFRHNGKNNMAFADGHAEGKELQFITEQREASGISGKWHVFDSKRETVGL